MKNEKITVELTRLEKFNLCLAIADSIAKHKKQLERINERISKGIKTYYYVGLGVEDINKVKKRLSETIDSLISVSKKFNCP